MEGHAKAATSEDGSRWYASMVEGRLSKALDIDEFFTFAMNNIAALRTAIGQQQQVLPGTPLPSRRPLQVACANRHGRFLLVPIASFWDKRYTSAQGIREGECPSKPI